MSARAIFFLDFEPVLLRDANGTTSPVFDFDVLLDGEVAFQFQFPPFNVTGVHYLSIVILGEPERVPRDWKEAFASRRNSIESRLELWVDMDMNEVMATRPHFETAKDSYDADGALQDLSLYAPVPGEEQYFVTPAITGTAGQPLELDLLAYSGFRAAGGENDPDSVTVVPRWAEPVQMRYVALWDEREFFFIDRPFEPAQENIAKTFCLQLPTPETAGDHSLIVMAFNAIDHTQIAIQEMGGALGSDFTQRVNVRVDP